MPNSPLHFDVRDGLTPGTLDSIRSGFADLIDTTGAPENAKYAAGVIVEELSTNILEHSGAEWLELELRSEGGRLEIGLRDNGKAFNPAEVFHDVNFEPDLTEFTNRQLGIYMVRRLSHSLQYQREASGLNHLTLELSQDLGQP